MSCSALRRALASGATLAEIATTAGCSRTMVQDQLARYGLVAAGHRGGKAAPHHDELVAAHRAGGIKAIVERYDVSPSLARRWLLAAGVKLDGSKRGAPRRALDVDDLVRRYEAGHSLAEIAVDVGVSAQTVMRRIAATGAQLRPRGPTPGS